MLRLLGSPDFSERHALPIPLKQIGLVAVVAYQDPRPVSRGYLAGILWPNSTEQSARHSLSQAIYNLRKVLGSEILTAGRRETILGPEAAFDLTLFRTYIERGAFDEAAELIRGEFCEGLVVPGCVEFDHWLENARKQIRNSVRRLLEEPLSCRRESLFRALSIDNATMPEAGNSPEDQETSSRVPFVGRVEERRRLESIWVRSKRGNVATALITGEAGIGKTALCMRLVKKSVLHGSHALKASGYELQRNLAYGIIGQLLHDAHRSRLLTEAAPAWLSVLSELLPVDNLSRSNGPPPKLKQDPGNYRLTGAVHYFLSHVARSHPVTVFVDDVQWADAASMSILHYVAHCDSELPLLIIFACRNEDVSFLRDGRWSLDATVPLGGLALAETEVLLQSASTTQSGRSRLKAIHEITGGNPLLIRALSARSSEPQKRLPPGAREYFRKDLARLSEHAQLVGAAISVAGEGLSSSQLCWLTDFDVDAIDSALDDLLAEGFLYANEGLFALKHDVIRDAFLEKLPPVASAKLHGRVARLLRDRGSPAAVVATQLTVAGNDAETCKYALEAAQASVRLYAYREAEYFYRVAIASAPELATELKSRIALSTIFCRQDRADEAEQLLRSLSKDRQLTDEQSALLEAQTLIAQLAAIGSPKVPEHAFQRATELQRLLPSDVTAKLFADIAVNAQHGLHDLLKEAAGAALQALAGVGDGPDRIRMEVRIIALQALNAFSTGDLEKLDRLTQASSRWPGTYATCLMSGALVRISRGFILDAQALFLRALQICEQYGLLDLRLRVLNNLGVCFLERGHWAEAHEQFTAVVRSGGSVAPKAIPGAQANLLSLEYERGRLDAALRLGTRCVRETPPQTRLRLSFLGLLGLVYLELGKLSKAREIETTIQNSSELDAGWSNDSSYLEIFIARMGSLNGNTEEVERRLRDKIDVFSNRDFYCAARMHVELLKSVSCHSPERALRAAVELRPKLATAHAAPLVQRIDAVIARCRNHLA